MALAASSSTRSVRAAPASFTGRRTTTFRAHNLTQLPLPSTTPTALRRHSVTAINNPGFSVGGPVLLPYIKDKAFFYFNYDQQISHGASGTSIRDIPTVATMSGDFTGQPLIYDPLTQTTARDANGNLYPVRKSFLSEYGTNAIPANLFDKVAANFQKFYPTPTNHIATGIFGPGRVNGQGQSRQTSNPRFLHQIRHASISAGLISTSIRRIASLSRFNNAMFGRCFSDFTACPIQCQNQDVDSYNPQITDVYSFSSRTINEVRLGYTFQGNFFSDDASGKGIAASLGWQYAKADTIPAFSSRTISLLLDRTCDERGVQGARLRPV